MSKGIVAKFGFTRKLFWLALLGSVALGLLGGYGWQAMQAAGTAYYSHGSLPLELLTKSPLKTTFAVCGDGGIDGGEQCDDGNTVSGDGCSSTCQLEAVNEVEPNNTTVDADASSVQLTGSGSISGAIGTVADKDVFKLTLSSPSVVNFEVFDSTGTNCSLPATKLTLLDSGGGTVNTGNSASGIGACSALNLPLAAGTYYIQMEQSTNSVTIPAYLLRVLVLSNGSSEAEPNDTQATANLLSGSNVFILGSHQNAADADYYALSVADGTSLKIELIEGNAETCESNDVDSTLTLLNAGGTVLGSDNDGGRGTCSQIDGRGTTPANSFARNLSAGTYYIKVTSPTEAQSSPNQFDYRLVVQRLVVPPLNLTVTKTTDTNDGVCDAADCSLREAVAAANDSPTNDTINFNIPDSDTGCANGVCTVTLTGGQLFLKPVATAGTLVISNAGGGRSVRLSGNNASRHFFVEDGANVTLDKLTLTNGRGTGGITKLGGAIVNDGTLIITGSTISGNSVSGDEFDANLGGGIYSIGTLTLVNSTVSGNSVSGNSGINFGGGIYSEDTLTLVNSTVSGNSASGGNSSQDRGGGIYNDFGTVNARNTIISANIAASNADLYGSLSAASENNLVGNAAQVRLAPLGNYGGATQTHALLSGSSAINAGNNCVLTQSCANFNAPVALTTDQRGVARLGAVDIGAFEYNPLTVSATTPNKNALNVARTSNGSATFGSTVNQSTVTASSFKLRGGTTANYGGTISFPASASAQLAPANNFKAGELITASLSSGIQSTAGMILTPFQWQFHAATTASSGAMRAHPTTPSFGAGNSIDMALGDIDGDGDLDALVANNGQAQTVWLNNGSGSFTPHPTTPAFGAGNSTDVALGDIDNDGDLDALVANIGSNEAETVWLNDGSGSFTPHPTTPSFGSGDTRNMALGDVDGDGDLDVLVANGSSEAETVWLNNGEGSFTAHPMTPSFGAGNSWAIALGDIDGDGDLDAVVANDTDIAETVWLNDGNGSFTAHPTTPSFGAGYSFDIALGDIDGDGDLDAVVANDRHQAETVWLNNGSGSFTAHPTTPSFGSGESWGITLGDIDGDRDLDALVANNRGPATVWLNDGFGSFTAHPIVPSIGVGPSYTIALGDLDSDGDLDTLVANTAGQAETVWLNDKTPTSTTVTASADPSVFGQPVTFTATVTPNPNNGTPAGTVTFFDGATAICTGVTLSSGQAQCQISTLSLGDHTITAAYSGDTNFFASTGPLGTNPQTVNKADTTVTITNAASLSGTPTTIGQSYAVQWSVTVNSPGAGTPAGNVTASDGTDSCQAAVSAGSCNLTSTTPGSKTITVTYPGDTNFNGDSETASHQVSCVTNPVVTTNADGGEGSLRQAIAATCSGSTITFANGISLIALTSGELVINKNLTIQGPGAHLLSVSGNNASRVFYVNSGGNLTLQKMTVRGGSADNGGGLRNEGGTVTVADSTFSNNATNTCGGGMYNSGGTARVMNSTFSNNSARSGGGLCNFSGGTAHVMNSTFDNNRGTGGGGGGLYNSSSTLTVTNSTVSGNSARVSGGGISNFSGTVTLTNLTVSGNAALLSSGGGISNQEGTVNARNTLIAGNSADFSAPDFFGAVNSLGHNLIGNSADSSGFGATGDQINVNPLLSPLASNGGPTQTMRPLPGSPAINAGGAMATVKDEVGGSTQYITINESSSIFPAPLTSSSGNFLIRIDNEQIIVRQRFAADTLLVTRGANGTTATAHASGATINPAFDQRGTGFNRQVGSAVDIGAVEVNYALAVTGGNNQSATVNTSFATPLQVTLTESGNPVSNILLIFTASGSSSGPSATFPNGNTATTNASGQASVNVNANGVPGAYTVSANTTPGLATPASFNLTNSCPGFTIGTPTAGGALGVAYSSSVAATPAISAPLSYQYSLANNTSLPAGLSLNATTGAITGTPTAAGMVTFKIKAELFNGSTTTGCSVTSSDLTITITCASNPVVTSTNDGGMGSLREAIALACPGSTITFSDTAANGATNFHDAMPDIIALTSGELVINKNLTINGPGADKLTVQRSTAPVTPNFRIFSISSGVTATLDSLTIANGKVSGGGINQGGGIFNNGGTLTVTNCTLSGNSASGGVGSTNQGGGIFNNGGTLTITNCTLSGNTVSGGVGSNNRGGGIYNNAGFTGSTLRLRNSTLSGNSVSGGSSSNNQSGGIFNGAVQANTLVEISSSTIASNSASRGGGLDFTQVNGTVTVNLRNTIIAQNTAANSPDVNGALSSQGNNLLGNNAGSTGLSDGVNGDKVGGGANPVLDPLLAPLGNYGGPTQTHRPLPGSPVINAGNNCVLTANGCGDNNPALATDQRGTGFNRQVGGTVDIGAFEANYVLAATGGTPQTTTVNTGFAQSLQATLTESGNPVSGVELAFAVQPAQNGAGAALSGTNPAATNGSGQASVNATANATAGSYTVTASAPGLSASFSLSNSCPTITATVAGGGTICPTGTAQVFVTVSGGLAPYTVTLSGGGGTLTGAGPFTFNVSPASTTTYNVLSAMDANGCPVSATGGALVTVNAATAINAPPASQTRTIGQSVSFSVGATGANLTYQWRKNQQPIQNATQSTFTIGAVAPADQGSYDVVVTGTCGMLTSAAATLSVNCPTITLGGLPQATAGVAYNAALTASPVGGNYQFSSSDKPAWLALASNGSLSGTPPAIGTYSFNVIVSGFGGACQQSLPVSLTATCPTVALAPANLPNASLNTAYPTVLGAAPAGGNYSFAVTGGQLPPDLTLNSNGTFSGAPAQSGTFNFRVTATGFAGPGGSCTAFQDYTLNVTCPTVTLTPASLPGGTLGAAYNQTVTASPAGSYNYSVTSGALPPGLTLNAATGQLTGSPTASSGGGSFNFRITATAVNSVACSGARDYSVTVACAGLTITTISLPAGAAGSAYSQTIAVNPTGNYSFALVQGSLPSGLALNPATGVLSGTPAVTGSFSFSVRATASGGCAATQSLTLQINCPSITLSSLATPALNSPYNQTVTASPSGGSYSFAVTAGALPTGLSLNAATGVISGTPTAAGNYNFTITATGFGACSGTRNYTGTIAGSGCPTIGLPELPGGQPGQLYNQPVAATPSGSYSYAVTAGSLPPGLTLYGSLGMLFGYPTQAGTFSFTITATNSNNCAGSKAYSVQIGGAALRSLVFGDFDGDGKADLSVWCGRSGEWLTVGSKDCKLKTEAWGTSAAPYFDVMTPGDYDGDGKMDVAVFRTQTGEWLIKGSRDAAVTATVWGGGTDTPVPGDYDGDGKTDLAVWRGAESNWYIRRSSDEQTETVSWGTSRAPYRDVPVAEDFDGDGKTDVAVFRQANGHWYIRLSSDGSTMSKAWGLGTDVPVAADYDGDGKADLAVWRGAEGAWYILRSSDDAPQNSSWGSASLVDVPAPGDYDGDGKADAAVWGASEQTWYIRCSSDGSVRTQVQGKIGDAPVTSKAR